MKIFVETERLILREMVETDIQGLFELDSDPEVHKYLGNRPVKDIATCRDVVKNVQQQYKECGIGRWAIIDKASAEFVGWSGLKYEKNLRKDRHYYDVGYRLKRKFWGKGIATETAKEALKYGFNQLNLTEICAAAHHENIASNKILTNIGLVFTETFLYDGITTNWYKLAAEDWFRLK